MHLAQVHNLLRTDDRYCFNWSEHPIIERVGFAVQSIALMHEAHLRAACDIHA